jgi:hypothetical protein
MLKGKIQFRWTFNSHIEVLFYKLKFSTKQGFFSVVHYQSPNFNTTIHTRGVV